MTESLHYLDAKLTCPETSSGYTLNLFQGKPFIP